MHHFDLGNTPSSTSEDGQHRLGTADPEPPQKLGLVGVSSQTTKIDVNPNKQSAISQVHTRVRGSLNLKVRGGG